MLFVIYQAKEKNRIRMYEIGKEELEFKDILKIPNSEAEIIFMPHNGIIYFNLFRIFFNYINLLFLSI